MTSFWEDLRKARSLARWQRILRKRDQKRTPTRILLLGVVGILFLFSIGSASVSPLFALRDRQSEMDGFVVLASVLAGAFLLYLQLIVAYQRLIVEDTSILLVAPLSGRAILLLRLLESARAAFLFGLLGLPMTGAYLWLSKASWVAYPFGLLALWLMTWLIASLAMFFITLLLRIIRRPISRDILGVVSSIVAIGILLGTRFLAHDAAGTAGQVAAGSLFSSWLSPGLLYLPLSWFGHSLIGLHAQFGVGLGYIVMMILLVLLVANLMFTTGGPILHERLTQLSDVAASGHRRRRSRGSAAGARGRNVADRGAVGSSRSVGANAVSRIPSRNAPTATIGKASAAAPATTPATAPATTPATAPATAPVTAPAATSMTAPTTGAVPSVKGRTRLIWEIARKDLIRLRRTPADLANYLFPTAYLLYFITQPQRAGGQGAVFGLLPVFILILASTMGRVPISSFGTEGEQVWLYLQAPASGNTVLWAKWLFGTLPTLVWWELLCLLLTLFHAISASMAVLLGVSGLWLIPGAVALTLPFAIHGAAFVPRMVGRRNRYVNGRSSWYILVIFPYLLLQLVPLTAVSVVVMPLLPVGGAFGSLLHQAHNWTWLLYVGLIGSLLVAALGTWIGRSMGLEAWRNKRIELYETGSLDGNN